MITQTPRAAASAVGPAGAARTVEEQVVLRDGSAIVVRPLATGDVAAIASWFDGLGPQKLSVISVPGRSLPVSELQALGVARVSTGPFTQRVALTALQDAAADVVGGGVLPSWTRSLN